MMHKLFSVQFLRFVFVGVLNVLLSVGIFNFLMWVTGIAHGIEILFFSIATFAIAVTHSFFWNKFLVFQDPEAAHREYVRFFTVTSATSLINVGIISFLVNGLGAPAGITPTMWANIALFVTIPISAFGNYFGYALFVFKEAGTIEPAKEK